MTTAAVSPPATTIRLGYLRHAALGAFWLGTYYVIAPVYTVLLQVQVTRAVPVGNQGEAIGLATAFAGFMAMVVPPLVGYWSDRRLVTRWGRRRPVMVVGALGTAAALVAMRYSTSFVAIAGAFLAVVTFINFSSAAYVALIPDTVQRSETGRASGFLGLFVQGGNVLGLLTLLVMSRAHHLLDTYWLLVAVYVLTLLPSLWAIRGEEPARPPAREGFALRKFLQPLWKGDFAWAVFTRFLYTSAFYAPLPFLLVAFRDIQKVPQPDQFTALFELVVTAAAVPLAIFCGILSDRHGRKRFVYSAGGISAAVLTVFLLGDVLSPTTILLLGVVYGLGYGAYTAVDWALALDTLPDRANSAKDLGLFHVADALPRVFIPVIAGAVIDVFNQVRPELGYRAVFVFAAVLYLASTVLVRQIRSVR